MASPRTGGTPRGGRAATQGRRARREHRPTWPRFSALLLCLTLLPETAAAQRRCTRGKPCGNTCINVNYTCRLGSTPPPPPPTATPPAPRSLIGPAQAAPPAGGFAPPGVAYAGSLSYCTTGLASVRDLLLVGDVRPSAIIGRDLMVGTGFDAPSVGDTTPAELVAVRCPEADKVTLYVRSRGRLVALDARSIPVRSGSGSGEPGSGGNVRIREGGRVLPAVVWLDAFGVATLRPDQ